ncbi:hypothetical protein ACFL0V_06750 [Nanoarchaeota archaeon]
MSRMMQIDEYIEHELKSGKSKEWIKSHLLKRGNKKEDVMHHLVNHVEPGLIKKYHGWNILLVVLLSVVTAFKLYSVTVTSQIFGMVLVMVNIVLISALFSMRGWVYPVVTGFSAAWLYSAIAGVYIAYIGWLPIQYLGQAWARPFWLTMASINLVVVLASMFVTIYIWHRVHPDYTPRYLFK